MRTYMEAPDPSGQGEAGTLAMMNLTKKTLLVVDDDRWTRYALARIFQHQGWDVRVAATVAEGLDLLGTGPTSVILDLELADGGGESVLRRVRQDGLDSRVVICTGVTARSRLEGLEPLRPDAVVHKPVE